MRQIILSFSLSFIGITAIAQQHNSEIKGVVRTKEQEIVPFANIVAYKLPDSSFVKGTTADLSGVYLLSGLPYGSYYLVVSSIGFQKLISNQVNLTATRATVTLDLAISEDATQMDEVVIQAQRQLVKQEAGILSVNIKNSTLNAGKTLAEALKRVPGVVVDKDGKITLKGKQGVLVMIDDKPLYMDADQIGAILKAIPADQVKSIEVLTSPSAKYDAAGNAGIINIKMEKGAYEGFTGTGRTSYGHGVYPKYYRFGKRLILGDHDNKETGGAKVGRRR